MNSTDLVGQDQGGAFAPEGFGTGRSPSPRQPGPGDLLEGKYQLVGLLGEGGMGTVWRAHSVVLDVDVAIKVLRTEHGEGRAGPDRLLREAQATAALGHPAIVRAFDFGETETGEPFLVMELCEGCSLASWLEQRGRMSAAQAVQMLLPVADGLCAAHAQGIIHRDVKPANIIAVPGRQGTYQPKIVDFGIAKMAKPGGPVLTEYGTVLGSLEYMSPEQADGRVVGEQADVWGLSVVLYELITGRRPFEGPTAPAMLLALYTKPPTPTTELAAGDAELWDIIARGLQKSCAERWPTMCALGRALAEWATQRGMTADAAGAPIANVWLGRTSGLDWAPVGPVSTAPASPLALSVPLSATAQGDTLLSLTSPRGPPTAPATSAQAAVAPPRRARAKARLAVGALAALVLGLGVVGLRNHGAGATTRANEPPTVDTVVAPAKPLPTATPAPTMMPCVAGEARCPVSTPAPSAAASSAPAAPRHRSRLRMSPMPLPSRPGF